MAKQIKLHIPEPCHQNWNEMTATEQGAFCSSCKKNVIDFTRKTENEIYETVTRSKQPMCGRFTAFQLEQPIRKTEIKNGFFNWRAAATALAGLFSFSKIFAHSDTAPATKQVQTEKPVMSDTILHTGISASTITGNLEMVKVPAMENTPQILKGRVTDAETGEELPVANVFLKHARLGTVTDFDGNFQLEINRSYFQEDTLVVSYVGYKTKEIPLKQLPANGVIELAVTELHLEPMTITMGFIINTKPEPTDKHRSKNKRKKDSL